MVEKMQSHTCDVIVVGAGNAAFAGALSAHENGASVTVLEKAPKEERGGNTWFSGGTLRATIGPSKDEILELLPDLTEYELDRIVHQEFTADDFYNELMKLSQGKAPPDISELIATESESTLKWYLEIGVKYELALSHARPTPDGKLVWPKGAQIVAGEGGGAGLSDQLFQLSEKRGIEVLYEHQAVGFLTDLKSQVRGVMVRTPTGELREFKSKAVILGCGGFESNPRMRDRYLGVGWDLAKVRGTRFNTGEVLFKALDMGAQATGHWSGCHASPLDADAPNVGGGTAETRRYSYPYGITVNIDGERFYDEGESFREDTYAKTGKIYIGQPKQLAIQIFDANSEKYIMAGYQTSIPVTANSIGELAEKLDILPSTLEKTVADYNAAVQPDLPFDHTIKDGKCTVGVYPPKTNWAQRIDTPPFKAYFATTGVTFTYGGLKVTTRAEVLDTVDRVIPGLYATGEIVGAPFFFNYASGYGLMKGMVLGRISGANAAAHRPD